MSNKLEEELKALRQEITDNRKAAMERRQRSSEIRDEIKELEEKLLLRKAEQGSNNSKQWALEKSVKAGICPFIPTALADGIETTVLPLKTFLVLLP